MTDIENKFKKLIEAMKDYSPSKEDIEAFHLRIKAREIEFAEQSELQTPTSEWYERNYYI